MSNKRNALRAAFNRKLELERAEYMQRLREDIREKQARAERLEEMEVRRLLYGSSSKYSR